MLLNRKDFPDAGYCLARLRIPAILALRSAMSNEETIRWDKISMVSEDFCRAGVLARANIFLWDVTYLPLVFRAPHCVVARKGKLSS